MFVNERKDQDKAFPQNFDNPKCFTRDWPRYSEERVPLFDGSCHGYYTPHPGAPYDIRRRWVWKNTIFLSSIVILCDWFCSTMVVSSFIKIHQCVNLDSIGYHVVNFKRSAKLYQIIRQITILLTSLQVFAPWKTSLTWYQVFPSGFSINSRKSLWYIAMHL